MRVLLAKKGSQYCWFSQESIRSYIVVERNWMRKARWSIGEVGEVSGLASSHVVLVFRSGKFAPELEESDQSENLPLGIVADSIPESRRVGFRREWCSVHLHGPGEFDTVGMHNVSNEREHGNSSVFDFGVTKESNCFFVGSSPEGSFSQVQWIVKAQHGIEVLGKRFQIGLGLLQRDRCAGVAVGGRCECGSRGGEGKKDGGRFHLYSAVSIVGQVQ